MVILLTDKATSEQIKLAAEDWKFSLNPDFLAEYSKLSTYLATICRLLIEGDTKLADILSRRILKNFYNVPGKFGKYSLVEHLEKIVNLEGGRMRAAERAMTASIILSR